MAWIKRLMDLVRIFLTITRPYSILFLNSLYRVIFGAKQKLPPIEDRLLLIPAVELAEKIRKKQLKSEEVMKAYIKRIKEVEPLVNACVDGRFTDALREAKAVDQLLASGDKSEEDIAKETPLLGVPFSCKESIGVKGMIQMCGIFAAKDRRAPEDAVSTSLYRKAGAIPVVATNVPEFCTWWESANTAFGTTFNPYDKTRCAGGSSGGEAAVLAYAGSVIGIGNDLAGSIRVPSAFNGIYGLKPTPGMISNQGFWPADGEEGKGIDNYVGTGPMCRYARDLPLLAGIMSEQRIKFDRQVDFKKINIFYAEEFPGYLLEPIPDIKAAVKKASKYFEDVYGNSATRLHIPELQYALEIWESKLLEVGLPPFRDAVLGPSSEKSSLFSEFLKAIFGRSDHTIPALYYSAIERRAKDSDYHRFLQMFSSLKQKLEEVLEGDAILLIPTHPETAPHHLMTIPKYPNQAYTCIFNVLGLPSTQIPAGLSDGLPIGIQAVSKANNDYLCVTTALELETVFGGWRSPSEISA